MSIYELNLNSFVTGKKGMVVSAHPLASEAGIKILKMGGNAIDATIAVASTLCVVEPYMSGLGGVGVALVYTSQNKLTRSLNFSGKCPININSLNLTKNDLDSGPLSSLIPGVVSGWSELHKKYGSLNWEKLFDSAIYYANAGFELSPLGSYIISESVYKLKSNEDPYESILDSLGNAPKPGTKITMPLLGQTLSKIAIDSSTFYQGQLAQNIVQENQSYGGLFKIEDFNSYKARWETPIKINYQGYDILTTPPNSSGFQILQTLKILENIKFDEPVYVNVNQIDLFLKAMKLALRDRIEFSCDPDYKYIPLKRLLSDKYIANLRTRIKNKIPNKQLLTNLNRPIDENRGMTTHFAIADQYGNVVSLTQTLGAFFGSGKVAGSTGVFMNNGCSWFSLDPKNNNCIAPSKRVQFVLAPTQIHKDGNFHASMGTTGGYGILQTTAQLLVNLLSNGLDIQESINAPRFITREDSTVIFENQFSNTLKNDLLNYGHIIDNTFNDPMGLGAAHGLVLGSDKVLYGGADPRRDGVALGLY